MAGGIARVLRPTLSGSPFRSTIVTSEASQASRRAVSGGSAGPSSTSQQAAGVVLGERSGLDVHDDLVALAGRALRAPMGE